MNVSVDHVIVCVPDLDPSHDEFSRSMGLASVAGGRHPGHGTANRIVPLGDAYIELLGVVDRDEAQDSPFGRWALEKAEGPPSADALVLRTSDIEATAARLGIEPQRMSRTRPDGFDLKWRLAGLDLALTQSLPCFIHWDVAEEELPGRHPATHPGGAASLVEVVVSGDAARLAYWMNEPRRVRVVEGEPGLAARLATGSGEQTF